MFALAAPGDIVDPGFDLEGTALQPVLLQPGRYVTIRHRGLYATALHTYAAVSLDWLAASGEMLLPDSSGGCEFYNAPPWENVGGIQDFEITLPLAR